MGYTLEQRNESKSYPPYEGNQFLTAVKWVLNVSREFLEDPANCESNPNEKSQLEGLIDKTVAALKNTGAKILDGNKRKTPMSIKFKVAAKEILEELPLNSLYEATDFSTQRIFPENVLRDKYRVTFLSEENKVDDHGYPNIDSLVNDVDYVATAMMMNGWHIDTLEAKVRSSTGYSDVTLVFYQVVDGKIEFFEVQINTQLNLNMKEQETKIFKDRAQILLQLKELSKANIVLETSYFDNIACGIFDTPEGNLLERSVCSDERYADIYHQKSNEFVQAVIQKLKIDSNIDNVAPKKYNYIQTCCLEYLRLLQTSRQFYLSTKPVLRTDTVDDFLRVSLERIMNSTHIDKSIQAVRLEGHPHEFRFTVAGDVISQLGACASKV